MKTARKSVKAMLLWVLVLGLGITQAFAHCGECGMEKGAAKPDAVTAASPVSIEAEAICLGCTLKKEQGAKAQCSVYGHKNALRTEDGKIWTILENDTSAGLINGHQYAGKRLKIEGKKFPDARLIQVDSFELIRE